MKDTEAYTSYTKKTLLNRKIIRQNNEMSKIQILKAIFLQKYIRRLLAITKFQLYNNYKYKPLLLLYITKIQSTYRQRRQYRFFKRKFLLAKVLNDRYNHINRIIYKFKSILNL